jgi:hypothetical protein
MGATSSGTTRTSGYRTLRSDECMGVGQIVRARGRDALRDRFEEALADAQTGTVPAHGYQISCAHTGTESTYEGLQFVRSGSLLAEAHFCTQGEGAVARAETMGGLSAEAATWEGEKALLVCITVAHLVTFFLIDNEHQSTAQWEISALTLFS